MQDKLVRIYQQKDVHAIKPNLLIYGDVSGQCANCDETDIKFDMKACPKCAAIFRYITFRNIRVHMPKVYKIFEERPELSIVEFDDYKRNLGAAKAHDFFK